MADWVDVASRAERETKAAIAEMWETHSRIEMANYPATLKASYEELQASAQRVVEECKKVIEVL